MPSSLCHSIHKVPGPLCLHADSQHTYNIHYYTLCVLLTPDVTRQEAHLTPDSVLSNINTALAAALWAHAQLHSQPGPKVVLWLVTVDTVYSVNSLPPRPRYNLFRARTRTVDCAAAECAQWTVDTTLHAGRALCHPSQPGFLLLYEIVKCACMISRMCIS